MVSQTLIGLVTMACVIGFAAVLTLVVTRAIDGTDFADLVPWIIALVGIAALRALTVWASETVSMRAAGRVKAELRSGILDAVSALGPARLARRGSTSVATLTGRGMDALDEYFSKYLPQLVLTCIVTPVIVVIIWWQDWISGVVIVITLPLIPVFMALIGWATQAVQQRQWDTLGRLSSGFVDLLGGIATLKIFGRQHRQVGRMKAITEDYRTSTMKVLRVTFLSGFVLELASSLAVAIVAVGIGLRLIEGSLSLEVGLFVLLLAPEAFLPLRNVGTNFHAAAEGVTAAQEAFEILDAAEALPAAAVVPAAARPGERRALELEGVIARHVSADGEAAAPALHAPVTATLAPGSFTVLTGPSGVGKSSLVSAIAGFTEYEGRIALAGSDERGVAPAERTWLSWSPQRSGLISGTVADNVALGVESPDPELLRWALDTAAAAEINPATEIGVAADGLSGGQAQRVGIARALYRARRLDADVLILDEPTSALDHGTEELLLTNLRAFTRTGPALLIISHRGAVLAAADAVLEMAPARPAVVAS